MKTAEKNLLAPHIRESAPLPGVSLFAMKTGLAEAVVVSGSFFAGNIFLKPENAMLPPLTALLLDEGTKRKKKEALREAIEGRGASIQFSTDSYRTRFDVSGLKKDLPFLLGVLAEELGEPLFTPESFAVAKKKTMTILEHSKEDTRVQARKLFLGTIFPKNHPNYSFPTETLVRFTKDASLKDVREFHKSFYGRGNMAVVGTGDVDRDIFARAIRSSFQSLPEKKLLLPAALPAALPEASEETAYISGKENVDLFVGAPIGIGEKHPDFPALEIALFILGGNFSSRLFMNIREKRGLTYSIYSALEGGRFGTDGYFFVCGTFAPSLYEEGKRATLAEIERWRDFGVTRKELEAKKHTLRNSFKVRNESARRLSGIILKNAEEERPLEFLDERFNEIDCLTLSEVNAVIKKYIRPDRLCIAAAGSIKEK